MPSSPFVVNVVELLRRPATRRRLQVQLGARDLTLGGDAHVADDVPVDVDLLIESLSDGIIVSGVVRTTWSGTCRRCLGPAEGPIVVRRAGALPGRTRRRTRPSRSTASSSTSSPWSASRCCWSCRWPRSAGPTAPACAPTCGVDRNDAPCDCATETGDPRWAALDELRGAAEPGR